MTTELDTEPAQSEAPPCWPPLAHLIRPEDRPVRKGSLALCGERLMGIDLEGTPCKMCAKCVEIARKEDQ